MGILDEAIREHLELKRQHGAAAAELKQIEDEAFGPPARPGELEQPLSAADEPPPPSDAVAEAPTTHMPLAETEAAPPEDAAPTVTPEEPQTEPAGAEPAPPVPEPAPAPESPPAAEEEQPALEHEIVSEAAPPEAAPEPEAHEPAEAPAEEAARREIVEQPTQHYDVLEGEVVTEEPAEAPLDERFEVEEAEAEPLADADEEETEFFDEKSLSDELDQALDAPVEEQAPPPPAPTEEDAQEVEEPESGAEEEPPPAEEGGGFYDQDDDVLEETPEFLQDTPESDRLWFEQKPPKDFDFDD